MLYLIIWYIYVCIQDVINVLSFNWLIICYLAPIARTKRFAWKDRWIGQRVFLCRYLLQETIFNQTSRVLVAEPCGFQANCSDVGFRWGKLKHVILSQFNVGQIFVYLVTPAVWNPAEFFKPAPLRHSAGSRSELFAQPLCWNQGLAWPWDYHGTAFFWPAWMVDMYGKCR